MLEHKFDNKIMYSQVQGVQDQIFQKEFAVPPFKWIFDPKLVNTK